MTGFPNPYQEDRSKSPGELSQEYSELIKMAASLFGLSLTDKERAAIPLLVGAVLRERHKIDLNRIANLLKMFIPT